ncbi:GspH/FimT family protein [Ignatzschineria larvae DSM 13226]|uniref:GspH/FimT family protein n=1 Tax=Ignatzschineria larvae DSM 13226 TaxID=1111732 RepID=A0ABZ3C224_9GAMM|nr:GspH/FimT family protein [Ignatzschineria larvae]
MHQCRNKNVSSISQTASERGISLIESLITLLLIALIALFATPLYHNLKITLQAEKLQFLLTQDLQLAKSLASIEHRPISLCGTENGYQCVSPQTETWLGWILFYDDTANFIPTSDTIIHSVNPNELAPYFILKSTVNIAGGINIAPRREYAYGMGRSLPNGRIKLCPQPAKISNSSNTSDHSNNQEIQTDTEWIINVYGYFRVSKEKGRC